MPPRAGLTSRVVLLSLLGLLMSAAGLIMAFCHLSWEGGPRLYARVHAGELRSALRAAHGGPLGAFLLLNLSTLALRAVQLRAAARREDGAPPSLRSSYDAVAVGHLAHTLLPARLGEGARVLALCRAEPVATSSAVGAIALGRVCDLYALLVVTCGPPVLFGLPAARILGLAGPLHAAFALAGALAVVLYTLRRFSAGTTARLGPRIGGIFASFVDGLSALDSRQRLLALVGSSLCIPAFVSLSYLAAFAAFDLVLPAGAALVLVAAVFLAIAVPSAPSSLGVYHAAATFVLSALGADPARTAAFALCTHALGSIAFILLGGLSLARVGSVLGPLAARDRR
jgi:uncharacterized membrane protein YbhN (UPF0104 family)